METHPAFPLPPLPEYNTRDLYPNSKSLSSSQFLLYEEDPQAFWLKYVFAHKQQSSQAMDIGRIFSAAYADRTLNAKRYLEEIGCNIKFIRLFQDALARFPVLKDGICEHEIWVTYRGWKFRATLDCYVPKHFMDVENKTGKMPWTQDRVNSSDQITFQAWCGWKKNGVPFKQIILNWWNTNITSHVDIRPFKTSRSITALKRFQERVDVVIDNLEAHNFTNPIYN